jgi:hypothetical protein
VEWHLATITDKGATALLTVDGIVDSRHRVELLVNLLPLVHSGRITRIIGAMSATSTPHWLGHEPLRERRLKHHQTLWPDKRPHATVGRAGRQTPLRPGLSGPGVRIVEFDQRRFRVLDGGRSGTKNDKR